MRLQVRSLPLLGGLTIRRCRELWRRLQTRLGSRIAVALAEAGGYSSDWTPSLGNSICRGSSPRKDKKKNALFMEVELIHNVVLVSVIQQSDVTISPHTCTLF